MQVSIEVLNKTLQKTNEWLTELAEEGPFASKDQAYTILRAVLHTIRDRLLLEQAVHFSAEFPLLLKGIYFDNWNPAATPTKDRTKSAFLGHISAELRNTSFEVNPEVALQAVFRLLAKKISEGSIEKTKQQLPSDIRILIDTA